MPASSKNPPVRSTTYSPAPVVVGIVTSAVHVPSWAVPDAREKVPVIQVLASEVGK